MQRRGETLMLHTAMSETQFEKGGNWRAKKVRPDSLGRAPSFHQRGMPDTTRGRIAGMVGGREEIAGQEDTRGEGTGWPTENERP